MRLCLAAALLLAAGGGPDYGKMLEDAKLTLGQAVERGLREVGSGVVVQAELEDDEGDVVFSIDVAQGERTLSIVLDIESGKVREKGLEDEDRSDVAKAARIPLARAIEAALEGVGRAVCAELRLEGRRPEALVRVLDGGELRDVRVDAVAGRVVAPAGGGSDEAAPVEDGPRFTDVFGEDDRDLGPTGRNPFFVLEPGYVLVLEGKERGRDVVLTISMLDATRTVAGIEARIVEEKEVVGGEVKEITRDYFAISGRTANVYYLGEDVDVYRDGEVVGHEGSWLAGEKGARYGLAMPATPLLGARYAQEVAPGVALDRAEIVSLSGTFECPAGRFEGVLVVEETNALEKGDRETKRYARGVGLLQDGPLRLARYGKPDR